MGVHEIVIEGDVPAPPKRVFALVSDASKIAQWMPKVTDVNVDRAATGVGSTRSVTMEIHGMKIEANQRVTVSEPPNRYEWVHATNRLNGKSLEMLENVGTKVEIKAHGKGSHVKLVMHYEPKGIKARLAAPLITGDVKKIMEEALANLRKVRATG